MNGKKPSKKEDLSRGKCYCVRIFIVRNSIFVAVAYRDNCFCLNLYLDHFFLSNYRSRIFSNFLAIFVSFYWSFETICSAIRLLKGKTSYFLVSLISIKWIYWYLFFFFFSIRLQKKHHDPVHRSVALNFIIRM